MASDFEIVEEVVERLKLGRKAATRGAQSPRGSTSIHLS